MDESDERAAAASTLTDLSAKAAKIVRDLDIARLELMALEITLIRSDVNWCMRVLMDDHRRIGLACPERS